MELEQLGLYLRLRENVMHSELNRGKKELLSGVTAELEEWPSMARLIFKSKEEEDVIDQFTTVVRQHYIQIKKSQSEKYSFLTQSQRGRVSKGVPDNRQGRVRECSSWASAC